MAKVDRSIKRVATLKQVASASGVHPSTVSRVLNPETRHLIGDEAVARVLENVQRLNYRPNRSAAALRTGRSRMIGVVVPDMANPVFASILGGIAESLSEAGYSAITADIGSWSDRARVLLEELISRSVDGIVLAAAERDDPLVAYCLERSVPVVLVNRAERHLRAAAVVSDEVVGMQMAVDHLFALGHRRIGHISGPQHLSTGFLRRQGFVAAIAACLPGAAEAIIEGAAAYSRMAGCEAALRLLDRAPRLTALVAANDLLALGAYDALRVRGLSCPDDLSIVGNNDMPFVDLVTPPLTTVRIEHRAMGRQAGRLLLDSINRGEARPLRIVLQPSLIVRESTASVPT